MEHLLEVKSLSTSFKVGAGEVRSVNNISFYIDKNEILGVVGESGSGKSVTASSIMQILAKSGHIKTGSSIVFEGEELVGMNEKELRKIIGNKIAMIFQDPMTALNPVLTIGHQMEEVMLIHKNDPIDKLVDDENRTLRTLETRFNGLNARKKELNKKDEVEKKEIEKIDAKLKEISKDIEAAKVNYLLARKKAIKEVDMQKKKAAALYQIETCKIELENKIDKGKALGKSFSYLTYLQSKREIFDSSEFKYMISSLQRYDVDREKLYKNYINDVSNLKQVLSSTSTTADEKASAENEVMKIKNIFKSKIAKVEKDKEILISKIETFFKDENEKIDRKYKEFKLNKTQNKLTKKISKNRFSLKQLILASKNNHRRSKDAKQEFKSQFGNTKYSAHKNAVKMLELVGVNSPEKRMKQYPFEFSGGMLQRVMIAMALLTNPDLLIADEPTTALDVTIQAQILELIKNIQKKLGMGVLIITHDLGVVAQICDRVNVMYAGKIVEQGNVRDIFYNPKHEYTKGLIGSIPGKDAQKGNKLHPIEGTPVDVFALPKGCSFAPRCEKCMEICLKRYPVMKEYEENHYSCCFKSYQQELLDGKITEEQFTDYLNESYEIEQASSSKKNKKEKKQRKEETENV